MDKMGGSKYEVLPCYGQPKTEEKKIVGLQDLDGVWQEEKEGVEGIIMDYFTSIYRSDQPNSFEVSLSAISIRVSPNMNEELIADFKVDEV